MEAVVRNRTDICVGPVRLNLYAMCLEVWISDLLCDSILLKLSNENVMLA